MYRSLTFALAAVLLNGPVLAHALFPGRQVVKTLGERAVVRFQAANGRRDVSEFIVELFEGESWEPARLAVAAPARFVLSPPDPNSAEAIERTFSVFVDLDGLDERRLRVCTKSVVRSLPGRIVAARFNTRVCSLAIIRRF